MKESAKGRFFEKCCEASRCRICYQWGLPRLFYEGKYHLQPLGRGGVVRIFLQRITQSVSYSLHYGNVSFISGKDKSRQISKPATFSFSCTDVCYMGLFTYYVSHIWGGLDPLPFFVSDCQKLAYPPSPLCQRCQHLDTPHFPSFRRFLTRKIPHTGDTKSLDRCG